MGVRSRSAKSTKASTKTKEPVKFQVKEKTQDEASGSLWKNILDPDSDISPTEVLKAAHWIRQMLAVLLGFVFGAFQLTGFPAIVTFISLSFMGPTALLSSIRELDIEEINKTNTIQMEGFVPATALFILTWVVSYTVFLPGT